MYVGLDLAFDGGSLFAANNSGIYGIHTQTGDRLLPAGFNAGLDGLGIARADNRLFGANGSEIY